MNLDDLSPINAEAGVKMELHHPASDAVLMQDDGETPITITLRGQDSKAHKAATNAATDRRLARTAERGRSAPMTVEGLEADGLSVVVACTVAWAGVKVGDALVECTPETARTLYTRFPWVREQAEAFIGSRRNFMPAAAA